MTSDKYKNIWEVFDAKKFLASIHGAPCTSEMKRITVEEVKRVDRFKAQNEERIIECPLIDAGLTKKDCLDILVGADIEIPMMYKLGFKNNNCLGCVKARDNLDYWKRIRKYFPERFEWYAKK